MSPELENPVDSDIFQARRRRFSLGIMVLKLMLYFSSLFTFSLSSESENINSCWMRIQNPAFWTSMKLEFKLFGTDFAID